MFGTSFIVELGLLIILFCLALVFRGAFCGAGSFTRW